MKYYVTIYIDELLEFQTIKDLLNMKGSDLTHAFLGLTKGKSPNELDEQDKELRQEYLKNKEWDKIDQKQYETKEVNEFNDGFKKFFLTETIKILDKLSYNRITYYIRSNFANSYLF